MNRANDRVVLTTNGAELLRLTVEQARKDRSEFRRECERLGLEFSDVSQQATQYDEVAAARERAEWRKKWERYASGDQRAREPDHWDIPPMPTWPLYVAAGLAIAGVVAVLVFR